jgi:hypothetical protein
MLHAAVLVNRLAADHRPVQHVTLCGREDVRYEVQRVEQLRERLEIEDTEPRRMCCPACRITVIGQPRQRSERRNFQDSLWVGHTHRVLQLRRIQSTSRWQTASQMRP